MDCLTYTYAPHLPLRFPRAALPPSRTRAPPASRPPGLTSLRGRNQGLVGKRVCVCVSVCESPRRARKRDGGS